MVPAMGKECPTVATVKCVASTTTTTTPAPVATLAKAADIGDTKLEVDVQNIQDSLGAGDIIILNIGASTQETLTVTGFGSIKVKEPLKYQHDAGETITLSQKAPKTIAKSPGNKPGGDPGATAAIVVVIVVVLLLVAGGVVATIFVLKMRRESAGGGHMKIGPRGNKAITIASTDDMNSPTY